MKNFDFDNNIVITIIIIVIIFITVINIILIIITSLLSQQFLLIAGCFFYVSPLFKLNCYPPPPPPQHHLLIFFLHLTPLRVLQSSSFVSSFFQFKKAALYVITHMVQVFNTYNWYFPLRRVFIIIYTFFWYNSFTLLFILSHIILPSFKTPRYLYPLASSSPISSPFVTWISSHRVFLPLNSNNRAYFKKVNSIFKALLHCRTVLIKEYLSWSFFPYSFRLSMKTRWLTFALFFSS